MFGLHMKARRLRQAHPELIWTSYCPLTKKASSQLFAGERESFQKVLRYSDRQNHV